MSKIRPDWTALISRKNAETPPTFECVICAEQKPLTYIYQRQRYPKGEEIPKLCSSCRATWARGIRIAPPKRVIDRPGYNSIIELAAVIRALEWEIMNGNRSRNARRASY